MKTNYFSDWLETLPLSDQKRLPLTHVAKFSVARAIITAYEISPQKECSVLKKKYLFAFYGRSAYRVPVEGTVTSTSLSPICFLLENDDELKPARRHPFDTGAFGASLYAKTLQTDAVVENYEIIGSLDLQDRLIKAFFEKRENYIDGDASKVRQADQICSEDQCEVRDYHSLITAMGTNQPDDRMHTIEYCFDQPVSLNGRLKAVIAPDALWNLDNRSDFLSELVKSGVKIATYRFVPNRPVEWYQSLIEGSLRELFKEWGYYA